MAAANASRKWVDYSDDENSREAFDKVGPLRSRDNHEDDGYSGTAIPGFEDSKQGFNLMFKNTTKLSDGTCRTDFSCLMNVDENKNSTANHGTRTPATQTLTKQTASMQNLSTNASPLAPLDSAITSITPSPSCTPAPVPFDQSGKSSPQNQSGEYTDHFPSLGAGSSETPGSQKFRRMKKTKAKGRNEVNSEMSSTATRKSGKKSMKSKVGSANQKPITSTSSTPSSNSKNQHKRSVLEGGDVQTDQSAPVQKKPRTDEAEFGGSVPPNQQMTAMDLLPPCTNPRDAAYSMAMVFRQQQTHMLRQHARVMQMQQAYFANNAQQPMLAPASPTADCNGPSEEPCFAVPDMPIALSPSPQCEDQERLNASGAGSASASAGPDSGRPSTVMSSPYMQSQTGSSTPLGPTSHGRIKPVSSHYRTPSGGGASILSWMGSKTAQSGMHMGGSGHVSGTYTPRSVCSELGEPVSENDWARRVNARKRQIAIAKGTSAYLKYIKAVPKSQRIAGSARHPETPDPEGRRQTKRQFDIELQQWKINLQLWDGLNTTSSSVSHTPSGSGAASPESVVVPPPPSSAEGSMKASS